jgi:hypothetical protein
MTSSMGADRVGTCPRCGTTIMTGAVLIEYDRRDGDRGRFAECPSCLSVVEPA